MVKARICASDDHPETPEAFIDLPASYVPPGALCKRGIKEAFPLASRKQKVDAIAIKNY